MQFDEAFVGTHFYRSLRKMPSSLRDIDDVEFDGDGADKYKAKYVLVEIVGQGGDTKAVARAKRSAEFHRDIFEPFKAYLEKQGVAAKAKGGGRVEVNHIAKTLLIYGYSVDFGKAEHSDTASLVRNSFGQDWKIECSDDGY